MTILFALLALIPSQPQTWYGPETADLAVTTTGNPFDPDTNDVRVEFVGPEGREEERLAYYAHGGWHVRLAATAPGDYVGHVLKNGQTVDSAPIKIHLATAMGDGFVRIGGDWGFQMDSGKPFWPLGHNLGWHSPGYPAVADWIRSMGSYGANWSRVWACSWDGKNALWHRDNPDMLDESALDQWDQIVDAAQAGGVHFQFVLFYHGPWSSRTDSQWADNPWNVKNGGWLQTANAFFTDDRAKKLSRNWVRYAVARYGWSPSVMSWELFNEVQWVDACYDKQFDAVRAWHDEMAATIRSIDRYHHLVTSSSDLTMPVFDAMDYYQPHGYPNSIKSMILAADRLTDKPYFFGEIGPSALEAGGDVQRTAVRDGIWTSLFRHFSGSGEYWTWERVKADKLESEFATAHRLITASDVLHQPHLQTLQPTLEVPSADLAVMPSGGWEPVKKFDYHLPADLSALGGISSFFQGKGHPEMRPQPIRLFLKEPKASTATIRIIQSSSSGGNLFATVNGKEVARVSVPGGQKDGPTLQIPLPAGECTVVLDNDGPDWVQIGAIRLPAMGKAADALGIGNRSMALIRITKAEGASAKLRTPLRGLPLADGLYEVEVTNFDQGEPATEAIRVRGGATRSAITLSAPDVILYFHQGGSKVD